MNGQKNNTTLSLLMFSFLIIPDKTSNIPVFGFAISPFLFRLDMKAGMVVHAVVATDSSQTDCPATPTSQPPGASLTSLKLTVNEKVVFFLIHLSCATCFFPPYLFNPSMSWETFFPLLY